jgi:hypothetical protein
MATGGILNMVQYIMNEGWQDKSESQQLTNRDPSKSIGSAEIEGRNRNWNFILKIRDESNNNGKTTENH